MSLLDTIRGLTRAVELGSFSAAGGYFSDADAAPEASPFLDVVSIRFALAAEGGRYRAPLVVTAWSFPTYRGS